MEDLKEYADAAAKEISELPIQGQKRFMTALALRLGNDDDLIAEMIEAMVAKTKRYEKITRWMTKRFEKDMTLAPKRVAAECVYYLKVNSKMMPFLIRTGRKAKDRLRHQRSYAAHKKNSSQ
ncbi:MAG: hypothetical protein ABSC19_03270 [Syntrophorhabdales bacterium]